MTKWKKKSAETKARLERHIAELKRTNPVKYQELIDAEAVIYQSWLEQRE